MSKRARSLKYSLATLLPSMFPSAHMTRSEEAHGLLKYSIDTLLPSMFSSAHMTRSEHACTVSQMHSPDTLPLWSRGHILSRSSYYSILWPCVRQFCTFLLWYRIPFLSKSEQHRHNELATHCQHSNATVLLTLMGSDIGHI